MSRNFLPDCPFGISILSELWLSYIIFQVIVLHAKSIDQKRLYSWVSCEVSVLLLAQLSFTSLPKWANEQIVHRIIMEKLLSMKNVFLFFKFTGISTIGMKEKIERGISNVTFSMPKMGIFYNIFLMCLTGISFFISIYYTLERRPLMIQSFPEKIKNSIDVCNVFSAIYVLVIFSLRQQSAMKIAGKIYMHKKLYSITINKKSPILISIVFVLIKNSLVLIVAHIAFWNRALEVIVHLLVANISTFIINSLFMQYGMILEMVKQFYQSINHELEEISKNKWVRFNENLFVSRKNHKMLLLKIEKLILSYKSLGSLSENISEFYSEPLSICVPYIFVLLVSYSYYCISSMLGSKTIIFVILDVLHFVMLGSSFIILPIAAGKTASEVYMSRKIVIR